MRKKMKQMMKSMKNEDDVYSFLKPVRTCQRSEQKRCEPSS